MGMSRRSALKAGVLGGAGVALGGALTRPAPSAAQGGSPAAVIGGALAGGSWEVVDLSVTTGELYPVAFPDQP